jgi:hypothetical protein
MNGSKRIFLLGIQKRILFLNVDGCRAPYITVLIIVCGVHFTEDPKEIKNYN